MKIPLFGVLMLSVLGSLNGQATPTASKAFDLQVGGAIVLDNSDYETDRFRGLGMYATFDFSPHFGAEIDFHQAKSPKDAVYERTYEVGGRYHRTYGRFTPYAKALYGRGVFNFVNSGVVVANLAYNEFAFGGGTDIAVFPWLNVRGDYEYQNWHSFPPNGLTPQLVTLGVAYHFPGGLRKGKHYR